jgi:hypothetical protein
MAGPVAYLDDAGVGSPVYVSSANPMPVTGVSVTIAGVSVADGADVAEGSVADAAYTSGSGTVVSILKGIFGRLLALVIAGDSYNHITTSTTTTVKNSAGTVKSIIVNTLGTVASTVTLKDNATTLAVIDTLSGSGSAGTYTYNIACATSIVVVTTGSSPPDVTVTYQ